MNKEKNTSPSISVIVPIYNMEKLMRKCLDSILAQTFQDYECLLIDDGSTDGSPAICDEYAIKDSRVKAFHKPNGGLSDARNFGLERAHGEYTIFFDPDDWVDEDCLKDMYAKAQEADSDMVICDYYNEDPHRIQYTKQTPTSLDHEDILQDLLTGKLFGFTWNKLLKRSLYWQYDLKYPIGMYGCEDQYTMCKLLKNDIRIAYLANAYYHYMHYGIVTESRRYDEKTYKHDLQIRDMFVELLLDTPYKQMAYNTKSRAIVTRAFYFGKNVYNSHTFQQRFLPYRQFVNDSSLEGRLIRVSLNGYYRPAIRLFGFLFHIKQLVKRMRHR